MFPYLMNTIAPIKAEDCGIKASREISDKLKSLLGKEDKLSPRTFRKNQTFMYHVTRIVNYLTKECGFIYFLTYF